MESKFPPVLMLKCKDVKRFNAFETLKWMDVKTDGP